MNSLTTELNIRFGIVSQSTSDREFYLNLHSYFDSIIKNEPFSIIFDQSGKKYSKAFKEIWGPYKKYTIEDESELDEKSAKVSQLERFSLYALASTIYVRVYLPIEYYKTDNDPEWKQDPVALILVKGYKYTSQLNHWDKKELESYNRWFDGKRISFEADLRRFHLAMLSEVAEYEKEQLNKKDEPLAVKKPILSFDCDGSLLKIDDKEVKIKLRNDYPNSHYVLEYIFDNPEGLGAKSYYSEVIATKFPKEKMEWRSIHRACLDINKKNSEQAKVSNFLVIKTGKSGYTQVNPDFL